MPRRAQNPHHPLTRLRRQLSTPDHVVTREELSQRTGVPLGSIKALESGRYALTTELALKISLGVPVNPYDLFRNADTLRDHSGKEVSPASKMIEVLKAPYLSEKSGFQTDQFVAKTIFEAAEKKLVAMQFRFLFREALAETAKLLGLESVVAEDLSKHLGEFDPVTIPRQFHPTGGEPAARWKAFERQVMTEYSRIWTERNDQDPGLRITPEMSEEEKQRLNWESAKLDEDIRAEALAIVSKKRFYLLARI
jgi:DNA-binding XRE family transcriptional regulator